MLNWLHFSIYTTPAMKCKQHLDLVEAELKAEKRRQIQSSYYRIWQQKGQRLSVCVSHTRYDNKVLWRGENEDEEKEWQPWIKMPWVVLVLMFTVETWLFSSFRLALGFVVDATCNQTGLLSPDFVFLQCRISAN